MENSIFVLFYFVFAGFLAFTVLTVINILFMRLYESMTKTAKTNKK